MGQIISHFIITVTRRITRKLDVYIFGVIQMELITGQKAIDKKRYEVPPNSYLIHETCQRSLKRTEAAFLKWLNWPVTVAPKLPSRDPRWAMLSLCLPRWPNNGSPAKLKRRNMVFLKNSERSGMIITDWREVVVRAALRNSCTYICMYLWLSIENDRLLHVLMNDSFYLCVTGSTFTHIELLHFCILD